MKTKIIILVALSTALLMGSTNISMKEFHGPIVVKAADTQIVYKAYQEFVKNRNAYKAEDLSDINSYAYVDINEDGTPELLLSSSDGLEDTFSADCDVFTYNKGKVIHAGEIYSDAGFRVNQKTIISAEGGTGGYKNTAYQLKNNKLEKKISFADKEGYASIAGKSKSTYYVNDKKVSYKTYNKVFQKYWTDNFDLTVDFKEISK